MLRLAPLFCLLITVVTVNRTCAQDPVPFPTDDPVWYVDSFSWGYAYQTFPLGIVGDTLIHDTLMMEVRSSGTMDGFELEGSEFVTGLYIEDRRYYVYNEWADRILLLYDFNLELDDTFQYRSPLWYGGDEDEEYTFKVFSHDSLLIDGVYHKVLEVGPADWYGFEYWIEGIGASTGLLGYDAYLMDGGGRLM